MFLVEPWRKGRFRLVVVVCAVVLSITALWWFVVPTIPTLHGHTAEVSCLVFSPEGRFLVSGSSDTTVRVWDLEGDSASTISRTSGTITAMDLSPNGKILVVATDEDETVGFNDAGRIMSIGHHPGTGAKARLLAFPTGQVNARLSGLDGGVNTVAFVANGNLVATNDANGQLTFWDAETHKAVRKTEGGHGRGNALVAFSAKTKKIGLADGLTVRIVDFDSGRLDFVLSGHTDLLSCLAFSPDGKTVATGGFDHTVKVWEAATGRLLATLTCEQQWIAAVRFSPDGAVLAAGSRQPAFFPPSGRLTFWDTDSYEELATYSAHRGGIGSIAFSPDGARLASGGADGTIMLWRTPRRD